MKPGLRPSRFSWLLAALAWIGLLFLFFLPVVFQGKVLAPLDILDHLMRPWSDGADGFGVHNAFVYDAISQYLPYDWTVFQSLRQDGYIGWNPYVYGGYALLENTMLCPGDWHHLLYRFFDFWTAWDLGIVLQFAIAGFGVLVLLRAEGMPAWTALVGAMVFAFYSQHILWIYHRWVLGASCWFPWIVWAVRRARRTNRLIDFWSVVFTALAFRGGHLQSCLFVAVLVLCLFLADWWPQPDRWKRKALLRSALPFALLSICSSILILDILLHTVPPYLEGCRELPRKNVLKALLALPTLVTSFHPTAFGIPQSLDGFKVFGCDLFDLKFAGATPLVLALFAAFRKRAPTLPRLLFWIGIVIPFTPLVHWFYSRSTVLFALGCAWLAAWTLVHATEAIPDRAWHRLVRLGAALASLWMLVSGVLLLLAPKIRPSLHRFVENSLAIGKASRHDWMLARSDAFLAKLPIWSFQNLIPLLLVIVALFAVWKLSSAVRRCSLWCVILVLCVFGELFTWSRTWITFSEPPTASADSEDILYPTPDFARALQSEMHDGGMLWIHGTRPDFDYFQLNAQVGIGLTSLQGYETIKPKTLLSPPHSEDYDSAAFAERGVSHVLVLPGTVPPSGLSAWVEILDTPALHLFRNPAFQSRWNAVLANGTSVPLVDKEPSPNRHSFDLPIETISVRLAEPFHTAWKDAVSGADLPNAHASRAPDGGTIVVFNRPLEAPASLIRSFRRRNPLLYPQFVLLLLLGVAHLTSPSNLW